MSLGPPEPYHKPTTVHEATARVLHILEEEMSANEEFLLNESVDDRTFALNRGTFVPHPPSSTPSEFSCRTETQGLCHEPRSQFNKPSPSLRGHFEDRAIDSVYCIPLAPAENTLAPRTDGEHVN